MQSLFSGKPNNLLYLPPGLAGVFFLLNTIAFPVAITFLILGGLTGALFSFVFRYVFREKECVKDWSLLLGTWVAGIAVWIYYRFYDSLMAFILAI